MMMRSWIQNYVKAVPKFYLGFCVNCGRLHGFPIIMNTMTFSHKSIKIEKKYN